MQQRINENRPMENNRLGSVQRSVDMSNLVRQEVAWPRWKSHRKRSTSAETLVLVIGAQSLCGAAGDHRGHHHVVGEGDALGPALLVGAVSAALPGC